MVPLCSEVESLRVTVNELVESHTRQYSSHSPKPKRCRTSSNKNAESFTHCSFCGSSEHLQIDCLKKLDINKKKLKKVASVINEITNTINGTPYLFKL